MTFSILFWNIWYHNQVHGSARRGRLFDELKRLIDQHQPDFIALNEAVKPSSKQIAPVIYHLRKLGYVHDHCANMAQLDNYWLSGATISSRHPLSDKKHIVISKNSYAAKRGHQGYKKEAVSVHVALPGGHNLTILVAHPLATIDSLRDHREGIQSLDRLVHSEEYGQNTILVGDMNEWRLIPGSLRRKASGVMNSRTGTILNPTWRYDARRRTPLRLNLDYVYWNKQSDFNLKDFKVLPSDVSDHRPLLARFYII